MFDEVGELCWESMTLEEVGDVIAKTSSEDVRDAAKRIFHRMVKRYSKELSLKTTTWQRAEEIRRIAERARYSRCIRWFKLEEEAQRRCDWFRLEDPTITSEEVEMILKRAFWKSKLGIKAEEVWNRLHPPVTRKLDQETSDEMTEDTIQEVATVSSLDQDKANANRWGGFVLRIPCSRGELCDLEY